MYLLTKKERRSLPPHKKAILRAIRHQELVDARQPARQEREGLAINVEAIRPAAEAAILELVNDALPGPVKMHEVLDSLADRADEFLVWDWTGPLLSGPLEQIDGHALRWLFRLLARKPVQRLYRAMKAQGELTKGA